MTARAKTVRSRSDAKRGQSLRAQRLVRRQDRKDKIETVLAQAEKLYLSDSEMVQAWLRLCRELGHMAHPEARMPRFNGLLHAVWIAASNDQT